MRIELPAKLGCLREARDDDVPSLARYANNRAVWINLRDGFPHPYALDDAKRFVAMIRDHQPPTILVIESEGCCDGTADSRGLPQFRAGDREAIGAIGLTLHRDVERVSAELGYWIAEPFWGRGITTAAVRAMVTYAFETFPLTRVYALPYAANVPSARVLEKAGFRLEARMRRAVIKDGRVQDQLMYAITDEEWREADR